MDLCKIESLGDSEPPERLERPLPVHMPRSTCKVPHDCQLCTRRVRVGKPMAKDFDTGEWVHVGCLVRKISAARQPA